MRVLLTSTAAVDQRLDGLTVFTGSLARHLRKVGVEECALFVSDLERHPRTAQLSETRVNDLRVFRAALPEPCSVEEALDAPGCDDLFRGALESFRPDVLHLGNLELLSAGMIEVAAAAGIPAVMTLHDFYLICPAVRLLEAGSAELCPGPEGGRRCGGCLAATGHLTGRYRGPWRPLARRWDVKVRRRWAAAFRARFERLRGLVRKLAAVVSPSRYVAELVAREGMVDSCEVIPNGSELGLLPPRPLADGGLVLGMLVHHTTAKGTRLLVEAFKRVGRTDLRLELWGSGDPAYLAGVRRLIGSDQRAALRGSFAQSDLPRILAGLDVLVLSSIFPEPLSLAVQDALAAGRPAIVPNGSGAAETVSGGKYGLVFERGSLSSLSAALRRIAEHEELLDCLRANILADRPVLPRSEVARRCIELYRRILDQA